MAKYTEAIKVEAVEKAKAGVSFKEIQATLGPNPKAVMRYLKKAGIDYTQLRAELKEKGILKPSVNTQKPQTKGGITSGKKSKKQKDFEPVEETYED